MKNIIEIACNHAGLTTRFDSYLSIITCLENVAVKFQIFDPASLCHSTYPFFSDLESVHISHSYWIPIIKNFISNGVEVWLEPFDESSFKFVSEFFPHNPIKIPSCDIFHLSSFDFSSFPCVGLAIGGLSIEEIEYALNSLNDRSKLVLFYGFQAFPTPLGDINISKLTYFLDNFDIPIFFADHTSSPDPNVISMLYSYIHSLGCSGFERHICLSPDDQFDLISASLPRDLKSLFSPLNSFSCDIEFINHITSVQSQNDPHLFTSSELTYRNTMQKKVVSNAIISPNTILTPDHVSFKRASSNTGMLALDFLDLYRRNKTLICESIEPNQLITSSMFASIQ